MSLNVNCSRCHAPLTEPGGLMFSPPSDAATVFKEHLCVECYMAVLDFVEGGTAAVSPPEEPAEGLIVWSGTTYGVKGSPRIYDDGGADFYAERVPPSQKPPL